MNKYRLGEIYWFWVSCAIKKKSLVKVKTAIEKLFHKKKTEKMYPFWLISLDICD